MHPPRSSTNTASVQFALGRLIDEHHRAIECRWLERVQRDVAKTPGVELTELRDGLPDYLAALVELLRSERTALEISPEAGAKSAWAKTAREHGITRVRIGFDITQLIHEFVVLRHVIHDVALEHGLVTAGLEATLADILEAGIGVAVQAYVDGRDFEARQRQAEHIGFLTHELRNPLSTAVLGAAQLRPLASAEQVPTLDILDRSLRKLAGLIDGVLLSQKLEAGKVTCHPKEIRLGDLMTGALEGARLNAVAKRLDFIAKYDPRGLVRVDPDLTRSAVQNLADNAVRYTDSGIVEVVVDDRVADFVIHVRDTCPGISVAELRTIFEPFERGSTRKQGTGLGLAIARRAIEAQGGSIGAESSGSSGCHFWIRLPKRIDALPATPTG